jgi:hypothetical protein
MSPKTMTDDKLRSAAIDVAYEFKLFRHAWDRYRSLVSPTFSTPLLGHNDSTINMPLTLSAKTATLSSQCVTHLNRDALLIHFRVLMDFFFNEKEEQDDIRARHYTLGAPRKAPAWYGEFSLKCNKLFAHLTYNRIAYRIDENNYWYDIPDKVLDMETEIIGFLKSLTLERLAWFDVIDD